VGLEEGRGVAQRCEAPLLQRWAEGTGLLQQGEEKALGRPHCGLPVLKIMRGGQHGLIAIGKGEMALN